MNFRVFLSFLFFFNLKIMNLQYLHDPINVPADIVLPC